MGVEMDGFFLLLALPSLLLHDTKRHVVVTPSSEAANQACGRVPVMAGLPQNELVVVEM